HPPRPARRAAAACLQDGRAHLGDDLPADHPGRRRVGTPARAPAAGAPARGDDAGDRVADDVGRHAAGDPAAAPMALPPPPTLTGGPVTKEPPSCWVITRST